MLNDSYLKGFAEAILPYILPYVENKVKDELMSIPQSSNSEKLLTRKQVSEMYHVSLMTLYRWEQSAKLVPVRAGRKVLYKPQDIERLIK